MFHPSRTFVISLSYYSSILPTPKGKTFDESQCPKKKHENSVLIILRSFVVSIYKPPACGWLVLPHAAAMEMIGSLKDYIPAQVMRRLGSWKWKVCFSHDIRLVSNTWVVPSPCMRWFCNDNCIYSSRVCHLPFGWCLTKPVRVLRYPIPLSVYSLSNVGSPHYHTIIALSCERLFHMPSSNVVHQRYCQAGRPQYLGQRRSQQQRTGSRVREAMLKYKSFH